MHCFCKYFTFFCKKSKFMIEMCDFLIIPILFLFLFTVPYKNTLIPLTYI
jgi:hypothetical protein